MRARILLFILLGTTLLASACGGKGLGTGTVGQNIGQEFGYNAISWEPADRVAPREWAANDLNGAPIASSSLIGRITVVNFWADWCPPCQVEQPDLVKVANAFAERGVRFLGVNIRDQKAAALAFVERFDVPYPSVFDPATQVAYAFRLKDPPSTYVLDRTGKVAWRIIGIAREAQLTKILETELAR